MRGVSLVFLLVIVQSNAIIYNIISLLLSPLSLHSHSGARSRGWGGAVTFVSVTLSLIYIYICIYVVRSDSERQSWANSSPSVGESLWMCDNHFVSNQLQLGAKLVLT